MYGISSFAEIFLYSSYGLSYEAIGFLFSINSILFTFSLLVFPFFIKKYSYRFLLMVSNISFFFARLIQVFFPCYPSFLLSSIIFGIGSGIVWPIQNFFISKKGGNEDVFSFAVLSIFSLIFIGTFSFIASLLTKFFDFREILSLTLFMKLIQIPVLFKLDIPNSKLPSFKLNSFRKRRLYKLVFLESLFALGSGFFLPYLNLFLKVTYKVGYGSVGLFLFLEKIMIGLFTFITPLFFRNDVTVISLFIGIASFIFLFIPFINNFFFCMILLILRSALVAGVDPIISSFKLRYFGAKKAIASSVLLFTFNLFNSISKSIGGILMESNQMLSFLLSFFFFFSYAILFYKFFSKKELSL